MTKITEGELLDLLPSAMKKDTDMACLSYAIRQVTLELLGMLTRTQTQCFVDGLPENILDVMAVETNAMYYDQSLPIEAKRELIRASYSAWYARAGTPAAVEELVRAVFGEGRVVEWFDFTEGEKTPGLFDIVTNAPLTEDIIEYFNNMIHRVKNERSHLRRVLVERHTRASPRIAACAHSDMDFTIANCGTEEEEASAGAYIGVGVDTSRTIYIITKPELADITASAKGYGAVGAHTTHNIFITLRPQTQELSTQTRGRAGVRAASYRNIVIS